MGVIRVHVSESASGHGTLPDEGGNQYLMREAINGRHQSSSVRAPSRARYATGVCGSSATA